MAGIADQINVAPEMGEEENIETPEISEAESMEAATEETGEIEEAGEIEEKEPTIKELMERLDAQNNEIKKANNRTQYLQRKLERKSNAQITEPAKDKPDPDDFETNAEYIESLTDWKLDQRTRDAAEKERTNHTKEQQEEFFSVIESGVEKYPDFNEVARKTPAQGGPEITNNMLEALMECENPVDVAYYLGQNVKESQRIARMSPIGAAREIGKLEVKLSGGVKTTPQKTKKPITPSSPIVGKTISNKGLENMNTKDFMALRDKQFGVG